MNIIYALCDPATEEIRYIGKSVRGIYRPQSHWYNRVKPKYKTYRLYRWLNTLSEPPIVKVIEICETKEELSAREMLWIAVYSFNDRLTNMTKGGEGTVGRFHSAETRRKISEANKGKCSNLGRKMSEEQKQKLRDKVITEEARKNYSIAQKRRMKKPEERRKLLVGLEKQRELRKKPILCSNGKVYESVREAARQLGIASPNIIAVLKGRYKQAHGYTFKYKDT